MSQINLGRMYDDLEHLLNIHGEETFAKMTVTVDAFHEAMSYRGYYEQVCFEPCEKVTLDKLFEQVNRALGEMFYGYKGGEYYFHCDTPVWINYYGHCDFEEKDALTEHRWLKVLDEAKKSVEEVVEAKPKKKRKSAADKRAEEEEARRKANEEAWAETLREWPSRMMTAIQAAQTEGLPLDVSASDLCFMFPSVNHRVKMYPSCWDDLYDLEGLEGVVSSLREEREENERKYQLRQTALAKLSKEEKEVLGLLK